MPQLSLYIDQTTLELVTQAARTDKTSVSKLVTGILAQHLSDRWPPHFTEVFGRVTDPSFMAPSELDPSLDSPRDSL